jgi:ornithine cyclodeaminase
MTDEHPPLYVDFLNRLDIEQLGLDDDDILRAVEKGLTLQGRGETVIEPRVHLEPGVANGHFNVLRGSMGGEIDLAGVKVVGDFVDNFRLGLPSELAVLNLFDRRNGALKAILDASGITDMRTGAVTAIGARHLARPNSRILGHIGTRGTSYWNVRLLHRLFAFDEIRVHSLRPESRESFAARMSTELGVNVVATTNWQSCVEGADIVVEASRLNEPTPLLKTSWLAPGSFVVPYGTMSAVELDLLDVIDKVVVDDWGQCKGGKFGALRPHVESGRLGEHNLHGELGELVCGKKSGRETDDERTLLWHRGLSTSDIALGHAMLERARELGVGQKLRFA